MGLTTQNSPWLLFLLDNLFAIFIIGPLVVFYWRGTWTLLDEHLYPFDLWKSGAICVAIGNGGLFLLAMLQEPLTKHVRKENWLSWLVGYHLYTYVGSFFSVCHWRGIWVLLDYYTGVDLQSHSVTLAIGKYTTPKSIPMVVTGPLYKVWSISLSLKGS